MTADHMTSSVQVAYLSAGQKRAASDAIGSNKEISAPATFFKKPGSDHCPNSSIVECKDKIPELLTGCVAVYSCDSTVTGCCDRIQVPDEFFNFKLVDIGIPSGEAAARIIPTRHNVVIKKRNHDARSRAASFQCRYLVIQGCPHAADFLPLTSMGEALPSKMLRSCRCMASRLSKTVRC